MCQSRFQTIFSPFFRAGELNPFITTSADNTPGPRFTPETRVAGIQVDSLLGPCALSSRTRPIIPRKGRRDSTWKLAPRELPSCPLWQWFSPAVENRRDADLARWRMKPLGEYVCQLLRGVDSDQKEMTVLDRLVGEVSADVNELRPLTATDDVVAPFNARVVVLASISSASPKFCKRYRR